MQGMVECNKGRGLDWYFSEILQYRAAQICRVSPQLAIKKHWLIERVTGGVVNIANIENIPRHDRARPGVSYC